MESVSEYFWKKGPVRPSLPGALLLRNPITSPISPGVISSERASDSKDVMEGRFCERKKFFAFGQRGFFLYTLAKVLVIKSSASLPSYTVSPSAIEEMIGEENFLRRDDENFEGTSAKESFFIFRKLAVISDFSSSIFFKIFEQRLRFFKRRG